MKPAKLMKIILGGLGVLVVLEVSTYLVFASDRIPSIALRLTPERTHFVEGTTFSWVLLNTDNCQNLTENQKGTLLALLRDRYETVYLSEADLPENAQSADSSGRWLGFNDGFWFNFNIVSRGPFWVRVGHSDLEGNVAGSSGEHVYVWLFFKWLKVWAGPMVVA